MKRAALAVSLCAAIMPAAAFAFDWEIKSTQSETVELNDNQFLRNPARPSVGSYSTLTADAIARTATSKFNFSGDGSYRKYWGSGAEGAQSELLNYGFTAHYEHQEKAGQGKEFLETSWRQTSTSLALLSDLGISVPVNGFLNRATVTGGIDRSLSALDSVSFFATSTRTFYDPPAGSTPFTDTMARGQWQHRIAPTFAANLSSEFEQLDYDNELGSRLQIFRNQLGINTDLSALLSLRGNVGAALVVTESGVNPLTTGQLPGVSGNLSSSDLDWIGDAVLTYRMLKNTTLVVTANQSISPSIVGSLFKRDAITAAVNQTINSTSTLSFSANVNRQISTTTSDFASASVSYSYNFIKDWTAQFTYRFQHRFATTGTGTIDPITGTPTVSGTSPANSNSFMIAISHSYILLPRGQ